MKNQKLFKLKNIKKFGKNENVFENFEEIEEFLRKFYTFYQKIRKFN